MAGENSGMMISSLYTHIPQKEIPQDDVPEILSGRRFSYTSRKVRPEIVLIVTVENSAMVISSVYASGDLVRMSLVTIALIQGCIQPTSFQVNAPEILSGNSDIAFCSTL